MPVARSITDPNLAADLNSYNDASLMELMKIKYNIPLSLVSARMEPSSFKIIMRRWPLLSSCSDGSVWPY